MKAFFSFFFKKMIFFPTGFMVRRDKEDVQLRLKEKRRHLVHIPTSELSPLAMGELQAAMAELRQCEARLHAASGAPADRERLHNAQQAALSKCRGATADAKEGAVLRFVLEKLQSEPRRKILLFVHHKSMLAGFEAALRREKVGFCVISGDVLASKRQEVTVQFKTDESQRVALCTIKASGVGLNLTAGSTVVFGEVPWTPGDVLQCAHAPDLPGVAWTECRPPRAERKTGRTESGKRRRWTCTSCLLIRP